MNNKKNIDINEEPNLQKAEKFWRNIREDKRARDEVYIAKLGLNKETRQRPGEVTMAEINITCIEAVYICYAQD